MPQQLLSYSATQQNSKNILTWTIIKYFVLSVIMLSVVMLNVMAPVKHDSSSLNPKQPPDRTERKFLI